MIDLTDLDDDEFVHALSNPRTEGWHEHYFVHLDEDGLPADGHDDERFDVVYEGRYNAFEVWDLRRKKGYQIVFIDPDVECARAVAKALAQAHREKI